MQTLVMKTPNSGAVVEHLLPNYRYKALCVDQLTEGEVRMLGWMCNILYIRLESVFTVVSSVYASS
jgi:hypothetical protein